MSVKGYVSSIQSMGTLDGPGVRFVAFLQGCNLRCGCCHNPETWEIGKAEQYSAEEIASKAERFKNYFGKDGGITLSGGEPLLQAEFCAEIFAECKKRGINTCLDTSGSIINDNVKTLLSLTDRILLDIKYPTNEQYLQFVGCSIEKPLEFLHYVNQQQIPVTLRQVIIPELNANDQNIQFLKEITKKYSCIDKVELLPFKKICKSKYDNLGMTFAFENYTSPTEEWMKTLESKLKNK